GSMGASLPSTALVQIDFKETLDRMTPPVIAGFAKALDGIGSNFIVSGGDWAAVKRLAAEVPGMRRGYDPCELPEASRLSSPEDVAAFVAVTEEIAHEAEMIYLDYTLILRPLRCASDLLA